MMNFFEKKNDDGVLFFLFLLKMNETWASAPSLEHEFMSLGKNLDLINFLKQ